MSRSEALRLDDRPERTWHAIEAQQALQALNTSEQGLSGEEAAARLERFGPNELEGEEGPPWWRIFLEQYTSVLIWILIVAAAVMYAVGHAIDAGVIGGIVVFITIFGFIQDYRAEQSIRALQEMATREAIVRRDDRKTEIDARRVVPGDVMYVESGDIVPADARLLAQTNLSVDEAALTGESVPVSKRDGTVDERTPLAERTNMLYKDTVVTRGSATAAVVHTGQQTEMGRIATALEEAAERDTPFQAEMDRLAKLIAVGVVVIVAIIAIVELVLGETEPMQVFLTAVGIAVSAIPEGLPAVVTLSLALGARRMAENNALIRRLPIVEALGSVDVICTDKTGTLTEEEMTVTHLFADDATYTVTGTGYDVEGEFMLEDEPVDVEPVEPLLRCGLLCNNVDIGAREGQAAEDRTYLGDPTEIALYVAAQKAGLDPADEVERFPRIGEVEFTSDRKRMTTVHETGEDGRVAYMKGAPEVVLERCDSELVGGEVRPLDDERRAAIEDRIESFAGAALRVMGFAYRDDPPEPVDETIESDMVFLGLQGMLDPPRPEVPGAIEACLAAGIHVVMITGDNAMTARAIGEEIGIESDDVLVGNDLEDLDDDALAAALETTTIFARTSPDHKTRILRTLQDAGHTVAMTGDGVNDAPAVKNADVGVAMGIRGTDVTEQASDIVLLDDNFATIREAIHGGRRIFDNVRKFVNYLLSGNGGEVTMIFTGTMAGFGLVITPIQIIWINVVTDGIPALTIGVDPAAEDIMERPPRPRGEGIITKRIVTSIVGIALFMTICLLPIFYYNMHDIVLAQTMVFTGFVVMEIVRIQAIRHRYGLGLFSNRWLVMAIGVAFGLQLLVLYTDVGQTLFTVEPLTLAHWAQIGVATLAFVTLMAVFVVVQDRYFDRY